MTSGTPLRRTLALVAIAAAALGSGGPLGATTSGPGGPTAAAAETHRAAVVPPTAPDAGTGAVPDRDGPTDVGLVDAPVEAPSAPSSAAPAAENDDAAASGAPATASVPVLAAPVLVIADGAATAGSGRLLRYTVEIEPATGLDPSTVAAEVDAALGDARSWARDRTFERVADVGRAEVRVVVATPATVDALCATAGLNTAGIFSCWTGRVAALNAWRWENGAAGFADITTYRTYLVNHEVGHALGYGHRRCPGPGELAPVMMQQSKGLDGCVANGWPYP